MRIKAVFAAAILCTAISMPHQAEARSKGGGPFAMGANSVGFSGGAIIGAHASPYYYAPYGYAPAYYHHAPAYSRPVGYPYAYGYGAPAATGYATPYMMVNSPCWYRRQAVYGSYGEVAGIRTEYVCQ